MVVMGQNPTWPNIYTFSNWNLFPAITVLYVFYVARFVWMGYLLLPTFYLGSLDIDRDNNTDTSMPDLAFFPKVTYCDFDMRQMNNIIT